jgi:hypothetical protein
MKDVAAAAGGLEIASGILISFHSHLSRPGSPHLYMGIGGRDVTSNRQLDLRLPGSIFSKIYDMKEWRHPRRLRDLST